MSGGALSWPMAAWESLGKRNKRNSTEETGMGSVVSLPAAWFRRKVRRFCDFT